MGEIIGQNSGLECGSGQDGLDCKAKGNHTLEGAAIGGAVGSIFGFIARIDESKIKKPILKIVAGSLLGGFAGYYLSDKIPFGLSTVLFPPIAANIAIHL